MQDQMGSVCRGRFFAGVAALKFIAKSQGAAADLSTPFGQKRPNSAPDERSRLRFCLSHSCGKKRRMNDYMTAPAPSSPSRLVAARRPGAREKEPGMAKIIGCDFHPRFQQIAFLEQETGEFGERRLSHPEEAERFYRWVGWSSRCALWAGGDGELSLVPQA